MSNLTITEHAQACMQQRSITPAIVDMVLLYSDIELHVGSGCIAVRLSWRAQRRLQQERSPSVADRARDIVLILRDEVLVTAMHAYGAPSRRYRRRRSERRLPRKG